MQNRTNNKEKLSWPANMLMKKTFFMLCLLLPLSKYATAQEQFVEVVVTDTLLVEPQVWYYSVSANKEYSYTTVDTTVITIDTEPLPPPPPGKTTKKPAKPAPKKPNPLDKVRTLALSNGAEVIKDTDMMLYDIYPRHSDYADYAAEDDNLNLKFTSRAGLDAFIKSLNSIEKVRGKITATYHPQLASFTDVLNAKLLQQAKEKGAKLAQLSGRKAGAVMVISEVTEGEGAALLNFFEKMTQMDRDGHSGRRALMNMRPDKIKIEKSLRIRFALQ